MADRRDSMVLIHMEMSFLKWSIVADPRRGPFNAPRWVSPLRHPLMRKDVGSLSAVDSSPTVLDREKPTYLRFLRDAQGV